MLLTEVGERVRKARVDQRMSQSQLAAALHVSIPYVSNIEHGKQAMSIVTLAALCNVLNVSADWILYNIAPNSTQSPEREISQLLADCTPAERSEMLRLAHTAKEAFTRVKQEVF